MEHPGRSWQSHCPVSTEQLCPERVFLLITGSFLHVAPTCGDHSTSGSQETSSLPGAESESLVNWIPFLTGLVSPVPTPHNLHFPQDLEVTIHGENWNPTLLLGARFLLGTSVFSELAGLVYDSSPYPGFKGFQSFQGFKSTEKCVFLFLPQGPQKEEGCSSLMSGGW